MDAWLAGAMCVREYSGLRFSRGIIDEQQWNTEERSSLLADRHTGYSGLVGEDRLGEALARVAPLEPLTSRQCAGRRHPHNASPLPCQLRCLTPVVSEPVGRVI
jgi:hypothetical protein